jgi:hypothetical protein
VGGNLFAVLLAQNRYRYQAFHKTPGPGSGSSSGDSLCLPVFDPKQFAVEALGAPQWGLQGRLTLRSRPPETPIRACASLIAVQRQRGRRGEREEERERERRGRFPSRRCRAWPRHCHLSAPELSTLPHAIPRTPLLPSSCCCFLCTARDRQARTQARF